MKKLFIIIGITVCLSNQSLLVAQKSIKEGVTIFSQQRLRFKSLYLPAEVRLTANMMSLRPYIGRDLICEIKYLPFQKTTVQEYVLKNISEEKVKVYNNDLLFCDLDFLNIENEDAKFGIKNIDSILNDLKRKYDKYLTDKELADAFKSFYFIEDWSFDTVSLVFYKDVKYWEPVFMKENGDEMPDTKYNLAVKIMIKNTESNTKDLVKFAEVKWEFLSNHYYSYDYGYMDTVFYSNLYEEEKPFWVPYNKRKLADALCNLVLDKKLKAYDYNNPERVLGAEEIDNKLFKRDTVILENPETNETETRVITVENKDNINSYVFYEDWYINPNSLAIVKKVKAVAPVINEKMYYDDKDFKRIFDPLFIIKLNE